jgi:hypothetical protein
MARKQRQGWGLPYVSEAIRKAFAHHGGLDADTEPVIITVKEVWGIDVEAQRVNSFRAAERKRVAKKNQVQIGVMPLALLKPKRVI